MNKSIIIGILAMAASLVALISSPVAAHCDSLDGPVVQAARDAIAAEDVTPVLKWVRGQDEEAIRAAFAKTLEVRRESEAARDLADTYFYETLVRIHRESEGAPYTGLKPAGAPLEPGVAESDEALAAGSLEHLHQELQDKLHAQLHAKFAIVLEKQAHAEDSIEAGRAYVEAYVDYTHFVVGLFQALKGEPHGHAERGHVAHGGDPEATAASTHYHHHAQ